MGLEESIYNLCYSVRCYIKVIHGTCVGFPLSEIIEGEYLN